MNGKMTIIRTDGLVEIRTLDGQPKLEDLQAIVGGYIELVPLFGTWQGEEAAMFCNEDGKGSALPINRAATALWHGAAHGDTGDVLVGDVVIVSGDPGLMREL